MICYVPGRRRLTAREDFVGNAQRELKACSSADDQWRIFLQGVHGFSEDYFKDGRIILPLDERESLDD